MATRAAVTACVPGVLTKPAKSTTKFSCPGAVSAGRKTYNNINNACSPCSAIVPPGILAVAVDG